MQFVGGDANGAGVHAARWAAFSAAQIDGESLRAPDLYARVKIK